MPVVSDYTAILATLENEAYAWNAPATNGFPVIVSYTFLDEGELPDVNELSYSASSTNSFNNSQRDALRDALDLYEATTGILFVETEGEAMISAFGVLGSPWGGWANYPSASEAYTYNGILALDASNDGYRPSTMLHEIGHAVGLSHPHDGEYTLASNLDNRTQTVMSYNWQSGGGDSLGPLDLEALDLLYGDPVNTSGWNYSFNNEVFNLTTRFHDDKIFGVAGQNNINGKSGNDKIFGREESDTLIGAAGNDTLKGLFGDDRLTGGTGRDKLDGGNGDDVLKGGGGADVLIGDRGDDILLGGAGNDTLRSGTSHDNDTLRGGKGNDLLVGSQWSDLLIGDAGADVLKGRGGYDLLKGKAGKDRLEGGNLNDTLFGGGGNDTLVGGTGRDTLTGGTGADRFVFSTGEAFDYDTITDFQLGHDKIKLNASALGDLTVYSTSDGTGTWIEHDAIDLAIRLDNITLSELENFGVANILL